MYLHKKKLNQTATKDLKKSKKKKKGRHIFHLQLSKIKKTSQLKRNKIYMFIFKRSTKVCMEIVETRKLYQIVE